MTELDALEHDLNVSEQRLSAELERKRAEAVAMGRRSLPPGTPIPGVDRDGIRGDAVFGEVEEDGRNVWRVSGVTAAEGQLVVCHVYIEDPDDRDWAVQTWQSLRQQ